MVSSQTSKPPSSPDLQPHPPCSHPSRQNRWATRLPARCLLLPTAVPQSYHNRSHFADHQIWNIREALDDVPLARLRTVWRRACMMSFAKPGDSLHYWDLKDHDEMDANWYQVIRRVHSGSTRWSISSPSFDAPSDSCPMTCPSSLRSTPQGLKTDAPDVALSLTSMSAATPYLTVPPSNCSRQVYQPSTNAQPKWLWLPQPRPNPKLPTRTGWNSCNIGDNVSFQSIVWPTVAPHKTPVVGVLERQQNHSP